MKEFIVEKEEDLKTFTDNTYAQGSFYWNYLLKNREIKVNGKKVAENVKLFSGDQVQYYLTPMQEAREAFYTVFENGAVVVIDKESGVNSEAVFSALAERGCYFIHRLDRNTCGLMIFAKTKECAEALKRAFKERRVEKIYHALCFGAPPKEADVLTAYLKKESERALVRVYDSPSNGGERIVTEYKVLERGEKYTKVEICLHTGKTHQIRAHMAHIGCPVVGDNKYGDERKNKAFGVSRQVLVAKRLAVDSNEPCLAFLKGKRFSSRFRAEL